MVAHPKHQGQTQECHCVVPTVTSPVTEHHPPGRTLADRHMSFIKGREGLMVPISIWRVNEALTWTDERKMSDKSWESRVSDC